MKLTRKQETKIAVMWCAGILISNDTTSFMDSALSDESQENIVKIAHHIATSLLSQYKLPMLQHTDDIIAHVTKKTNQ